jgi:hypothetical protein
LGDGVAIAAVELHHEEGTARAVLDLLDGEAGECPLSGTTTTSMANPRLRKVRSSSRIRSESRMKREVSGNRMISAMRSAPI